MADHHAAAVAGNAHGKAVGVVVLGVESIGDGRCRAAFIGRQAFKLAPQHHPLSLVVPGQDDQPAPTTIDLSS